MMKKYFVETQDYNFVAFVDDNNKAVIVPEEAFNEPLTLEVAKAADYSNLEDFDTAEEAAANYGTGEPPIDFNPNDYERVTDMMEIKDYREILGMSRAEMARQFKIPIRTLESWDAGVRQPPAWAEKLLVKELERMIEERKMKKIATTQLLSADEEIYFNKYSDGSYKEIINSEEFDSSLEELQRLIDSGKYRVTELTF